jgi:hypothetical protein
MSEAPTTDRIAQHTPGPWQQYMRGNQRSARLPRLISMTHLRSTTVNGEHTKPVESRTEDLVTALREARKSLEEMDATSFDGPPAVSLYLRAAAEIERLRETLTFPRITPEATAEQFMAILHDHDKGRPVNGQDLINALAWRVRNQRREIAKLHERLRKKQSDEAPSFSPNFDERNGIR